MFKSITWSATTGKPYCEVGQQNPLRWYLLKETAPGEYQKVSERWKCKDFMNEVVVCWHTKKEYSIYGFSTKNSMLNRGSDHLPFLLELDEEVPFSVFENNIAVVNEYLIEHGLSPVFTAPWKENLAFLALPLDALDSTFYMSMYTLLVRAAHIPTAVDTYDKLYKAAYDQDKGLMATLKTKVPSEMPEEQKKYLVYCNDTYNIKRDDSDPSLSTSMIHNCGIQGWNSNKPTWI